MKGIDFINIVRSRDFMKALEVHVRSKWTGGGLSDSNSVHTIMNDIRSDSELKMKPINLSGTNLKGCHLITVRSGGIVEIL